MARALNDFRTEEVGDKILDDRRSLVLVVVLGVWVTQHRVNSEAEDAFRDKVRTITQMANTTRAWFSENLDTLVPGRNFKSLNQVPVVVAWSVALKYANDHHMVFHTPSLSPRDPKNQPDAFERRALELFQKDATVTEYSERTHENGDDEMRYAQAVRLTQDCLFCHGDPAGTQGPLRATRKEGMKVGDLRGAFYA